jgi:acetyl-CoA acetyltransferase
MTNGLLQGQISIPGQVIFSKIGIEGIPVCNVENACASGSSAFNLAVQSLKAGTADVALARNVREAYEELKADGSRESTTARARRRPQRAARRRPAK